MFQTASAFLNLSNPVELRGRNRSAAFLLFFSFVLCVAAGCSKTESSSDISAALSDTNAVAPEASHAPVYSTPATPSALAATPAGEPDFSEMNRELRRWILRHQRPPKDFKEFSATAKVKFPEPPAGKKYAIDKTMHVTLVNN